MPNGTLVRFRAFSPLASRLGASLLFLSGRAFRRHRGRQLVMLAVERGRPLKHQPLASAKLSRVDYFWRSEQVCKLRSGKARALILGARFYDRLSKHVTAVFVCAHSGIFAKSS